MEIKNSQSRCKISSNQVLLSCPKTDIPSIHFLIKLVFTLSVSTATPERSFSTLKMLVSIEAKWTSYDVHSSGHASRRLNCNSAYLSICSFSFDTKNIFSMVYSHLI